MEEFANFLISHKLIDECAFHDPEGFDGGATLERLSVAFREMSDRWALAKTGSEPEVKEVKPKSEPAIRIEETDLVPFLFLGGCLNGSWIKVPKSATAVEFSARSMVQIEQRSRQVLSEVAIYKVCGYGNKDKALFAECGMDFDDIVARLVAGYDKKFSCGKVSK